MIGRWLTPEEIQWVFGQSEHLTANGYPPTVEACLGDYAFASVDPNWQALILADMRFQTSSESGEPPVNVVGAQ